jgi:hypothetical protein
MKKAAAIFVLLMASFGFSRAQDDNEFHLDKTYQIDPKGEVQLSTDDADVTIVGTNRQDIHVKIDRVIEAKGIQWGDKQFDVSVEVINGNIAIRDKEWGHVSMVGYVREEYTVLIEAPSSMSFDIKGDDGDFDITSISGKLRIVTDDGDIHIDNCTGPSTYLDLDDGDVIMDGGEGDLRLNMDDGDMEIRNASFHSIDMDIDDGDVTISTTLDDDGDYQFKIEDGSLDMTVLRGGGMFDIRHDDGRVRYDGSFKVLDEDEDYSELRLSGGEAIVKVRGDDTRVSLRANERY